MLRTLLTNIKIYIHHVQWWGTTGQWAWLSPAGLIWLMRLLLLSHDHLPYVRCKYVVMRGLQAPHASWSVLLQKLIISTLPGCVPSKHIYRHSLVSNHTCKLDIFPLHLQVQPDCNLPVKKLQRAFFEDVLSASNSWLALTPFLQRSSLSVSISWLVLRVSLFQVVTWCYDIRWLTGGHPLV